MLHCALVVPAGKDELLQVKDELLHARARAAEELSARLLAAERNLEQTHKRYRLYGPEGPLENENVFNHILGYVGSGEYLFIALVSTTYAPLLFAFALTASFSLCRHSTAVSVACTDASFLKHHLPAANTQRIELTLPP
jgi:hypothetical protein